MPVIHKNITDPNLHDVKGFASANNGDYGWKNEKGEWEFTDELVLPGALEFVDASVAPPTSNTGDIYVLSSGGPVNAGWGGAAGLQDWVRYDGSAWNVITPQKSSICYNKYDDSLYSFDGTKWSSIGAGSGLISVVRDSDSGEPTFFSNIQTALETCKATNSHNTITFYSDIVVTSTIEIDYNGVSTDVGKGYDFESLTFNFNGFKLTHDQANDDDTLYVRFSSATDNNQQIRFINGYVDRLSGTGTHRALYFDGTATGSIIMDKMQWYCENGTAVRLKSLIQGTHQNTQYNDFGGSVFVSGSGSSDNALFTSNVRCSNFSVHHFGSGDAYYASGGYVNNFACFANTGAGFNCNSIVATNFYGQSDTNYGVHIDSNSPTERASGFVGVSNSGIGVRAQSQIDVLDSFYGYSESNYGGYFNSDVRGTNGKCVSNTYYGGFIINSDLENVSFESLSGDYGAFIRENAILKKCNFIAREGIGAIIEGFGNPKVSNAKFKHCDFESKYDDASGHAVEISKDEGVAYLMNCTFDVKNASANCLYAGSAQTIRMVNSSYGPEATTTVNANVTVTGSGNYQV